MAVDLDPGTDLATLRAELDTVAGRCVVDRRSREADQRHGPQRGASAGARPVDTVPGRRDRGGRSARAGDHATGPARHEERATRLTAIGFTRTQLLAEAAGRAVIPIAIGSVLGAALAIVPSGALPGRIRASARADPRSGMSTSVLLFAGAGAFIVIAHVVDGGCPGSQRVGGVDRSALPRWSRRSPRVRQAPPPASGMRLAFTRGVRERGSVRGSVIAVLLSVAGVVAAVTFGVSLDRLVHQPFRYGVQLRRCCRRQRRGQPCPEGLVDRLDANPDVTVADPVRRHASARRRQYGAGARRRGGSR